MISNYVRLAELS